MRAAYLIMGVLLGFLATTAQHDLYKAYLEQEFNMIYTAAGLTGFNDGWVQGRIYTEERYRWMTSMCFKGWREPNE